MAQFDTVAQIITDVGSELSQGSLTAAYPSSDTTVSLLQTLLMVVGRDLIRQHPWLQCRISTTITPAGTAEQTLAADCLSIVDGTLWDRTRRMPVIILQPYEWEQLKAIGATFGMYPNYARMTREATTGRLGLEYLGIPTGSPTVAFQYRSSYWVSVDGTAGPALDRPTATTNVIRIDSHLITRALRLAWLRQGGYDSEAAQQDFDAALAAERSRNVGYQPTLLIGGVGGMRRVLSYNVPDTGYGA